MVKAYNPKVDMVRKLHARVALLVNPNVTQLSSQQNAFSAQGMQCVVARDLPTALLAITQHVIDLAVVSSRVVEEGDGWALSGVLRMVFPNAYIAVLTPETSVMTLQAAINNGLNQVYETGTPTEELVETILQQQPSWAAGPAN
jgi:ActR/RegA family two-component response regulator